MVARRARAAWGNWTFYHHFWTRAPVFLSHSSVFHSRTRTPRWLCNGGGYQIVPDFFVGISALVGIQPPRCLPDLGDGNGTPLSGLPPVRRIQVTAPGQLVDALHLEERYQRLLNSALAFGSCILVIADSMSLGRRPK